MRIFLSPPEQAAKDKAVQIEFRRMLLDLGDRKVPKEISFHAIKFLARELFAQSPGANYRVFLQEFEVAVKQGVEAAQKKSGTVQIVEPH